MNCISDRRLNDQREVTNFSIHGELYHLQSPLKIVEGCVPQYAQLFFYDPVYAAQVRSERNSDLFAQLMRQLTNMLHDINPYILLYKTAAKCLRIANQQTRVVLNSQMHLIVQIDADRRRENLLISEKIAIIISNEYAEAEFRDIVLNLRDSSQDEFAFSSIIANHVAYMFLHYVLLFPAGDVG